jgi:hypothetical protein
MTDACLLCEVQPRRDGPLCRRCLDRVRAALDAAPTLYAHASAATPSGSRAMTDRVTTPKPGSRSPVRDDLLELSDALARALTAWERDAVAAAQLPVPPPQVRPGYRVQRAAVTCLANLQAALAPPYGVAHASRLLHLVGLLRDRLGLTRLVHHLAAPCPHCDTRALIRRDGDDYVQCRLCGNAWPEHHYALLARIVAAESTSNHER